MRPDQRDVPLPGALLDLGFHSAPKASTAWRPPSVEDLQKLLPQYDISAFIACGGMGAVYKGEQKALKRSVAIKVLPPEIEQDDVDYAERFKREAQAMARLSHPNIVAVHDAGETSDGLLYFVMEYVEGTDVAQLIAQEGKLDAARALKITSQVLDALAFAHESGIIHRDIKPSNIMLDARGRVKVADFGLAKVITQDSSGFTRSDITMGTPDFMAPESMKGAASVDHRADLYAVGVMLYQMLTGELPRGRFVPPSRAVKGLDKRLDGIVDKALQTAPETRWATASELHTAIAPVLTKLDTSRLSTRVAQGGGAHSTASAGRIVIVAIVLLTLGVGGWLAFGRKGKFASPPTADTKVEALKLAGAAAAPVTAEAPYPVQGKDGKVVFPAGIWARMLTREVEAGGLANPDTKREGPWTLWKWATYDGSSTQLKIEVSPMTNLGIRARFRGQRVNSVDFPQMTLRQTGDTPSPNLHIRGGKLQIRLNQSGYPLLAEAALREPLTPGKEYLAEFYAIGPQLIARVNGQTVTARIDTPPVAGTFQIYGAQWDYLKDAQVLNLDGLPEAESLKLAGVSSAPSTAEAPYPVVDKEGKVVFPSGIWARTLAREVEAEGLAKPATKRDGPWLIWHTAAYEGRCSALNIEVAPMKNLGLRAWFRGQRVNGEDFPQLTLRRSDDTPSPNLHIRDGKLKIRLNQPGYPVLADAALREPLTPGKEYLAEFYAIGPQLIARVNGQTLTARIDTPPVAGVFQIYGAQWDYFKDAEAINLDGLPEAEALKLAGVPAGAAK